MTTNGTNGGGSTALARQEKPGKMTTLKDTFDRAMPTLARAATKQLPADRIVGMVIAASSRNPNLLECTTASIIQGAMYAAELGLQPSPAMGECYLIPRKNNKTRQMEANFQVGYRGLLNLVRRSEMVGAVTAQLVYEGERFEVELGLDPKLTHVPNLKARRVISAPKDAAQHVAFVYATARFKDGSTDFEVMSREMVEDIRKRFSKAKSGPWFDHWGEMAKKTVLVRLCKRLPMSTEVARLTALEATQESGEMLDPEALGFASAPNVIDVEGEEVDGETGEVIDDSAPNNGAGTSALKSHLSEQKVGEGGGPDFDPDEPFEANGMGS